MSEEKNILGKTDEDSQNNEKIKELNSNENNKLYTDFKDKIKRNQVIGHRLDYFPNSIPLGSFCFAVSFILYGFHECKVHKEADKLLKLAIFFLGGIGQLTAGIFEFIKSRTYPATIYITYGLYFLSFVFKINNTLGKVSEEIYFASWAFLVAPLIILSLKINIFFLIQNTAVVVFFIIKCIGASNNSNSLNGIVSGIFELIAGFSSLYICYGQILNEHFEKIKLPMIPLSKDNEIDDFIYKNQ